MEKMEREMLKKVMDLETGASRHHYFFAGTSMPSLEHFGEELICSLEMGQKLSFKGRVRHFSVEMPFFSDAAGALKFIDVLKENVSIARDCYDVFAGLILIECNEAWAKYGANSSMIRVMEYLGTLKHVRLIILLSGQKKYWKDLYRAFSAAGVIAYMEQREMDIEQCVTDCCQMIARAGYLITEPVKQGLYETLQSRQGQITVSASAVRQWIEQVVLNHQIAGYEKKEILREDVALISGMEPGNKNTEIGFVINR